jgi:hypothetical protein
MGRLRDTLSRLRREMRGEVESFPLRDGSRYYYEPMEAYKALFLHGMDCLRADSAEDWPEPPEVYAKLCEARDPETVLERFVPSDNAAWFMDFPYDREALISERRLVPRPHEPVEDLSE